jgi:acyl-CoA dehydrogenase
MPVSTLSPQLRDYAAAAREWGRDVAWGYARQADSEHALPKDVEKILDTCPVPLRESSRDELLADYPDGPGAVTAIWHESFAYADMWVLGALQKGLGHVVVQAIGTPEQRQRWYDPVIRSGGFTGFALSEAGAGSDTNALTTSATRDGDSWVIRGSKMFCSLGAVSDYVVVFARVGKGRSIADIKAFVVERGHPGFEVVKFNEDKLGLRCWVTSQLAFDDVVVPADHLLGWRKPTDAVESINGLGAGLSGLNDNRPNVSAQSIGVASAALDVTTPLLAANRRSMTPHRWSLISDEIERMQHSLSRARQLNLEAQRLKDAGISNRTQVATAKAFGPPNADRVIRRCMQLLGPEGSSTELLLEKWYRDVKILDIYEGTGQIMRMLVSRELMGPGTAAS